ncbi:hypothetical protein [uncultured Abyssibacter sp.]|uniref:hypothetical protein n=1 Tax=uncultured Abyssibacter sp. TaxID=2320202 RepID=UPI0032B1156E
MMSIVRLAVSVGLLAAVAAPQAVLACSTCKCGDPTITLMGQEKGFSGRLRLGVDALWRTETQGAGANRSETEETRYTLGAAYSFGERLTAAVQLPFVDKTLTQSNLDRQSASGLGDVDLSARYRLWKQGPMSGRRLAGVSLGLRLPTAETVRDGSGAPLDIDVQPDAGAPAGRFGGWYAWHRFPWFATASLQAYLFGDGEQGFEPGHAVVGSLLSQYALTPKFALVGSLDGRHAQRNRFDGESDPDSGGTLVLASAGIALRATEELVIRALGQWPVIDALYGEQTQDPSIRVGLAYDF